MLWYKAWRESQSAFLLSAVAFSVLSAAFVLFHKEGTVVLSDEPLPYAVYIWKLVYRGYLREVLSSSCCCSAWEA